VQALTLLLFAEYPPPENNGAQSIQEYAVTHIVFHSTCKCERKKLRHPPRCDSELLVFVIEPKHTCGLETEAVNIEEARAAMGL